MLSKAQQIDNIKCFFNSWLRGKGIVNPERIVRDPNAPPPVFTPEPDDEPAATSNGERVAKSWEDSAVREKRNTRDGVRVTVTGKATGLTTSTTHKSTFAAFQEYDLPEKAHVKFRAELKRDKRKVFNHEGQDYVFEIVPLSEV